MLPERKINGMRNHPQMVQAAFVESRDKRLRAYDGCLWDVEDGLNGVETSLAICYALESTSSVLRRLVDGEVPRGLKPHAATLAILERAKHHAEEEERPAS